MVRAMQEDQGPLQRHGQSQSKRCLFAGLAAYVSQRLVGVQSRESEGRERVRFLRIPPCMEFHAALQLRMRKRVVDVKAALGATQAHLTMGGEGQVDVDECDETAAACAVQAMPTFLFYKNNVLVMQVTVCTLLRSCSLSHLSLSRESSL